jgi:HSP20 family molecular chaperone IbpA
MAANDSEKRSGQESSREISRSSRQQPVRETSYDPWGFNVGDFFSNPFGAMRRMHDEMDRVFASQFRQHTGTAAMGGLGSWSPAVEVSERDNEINVCAELPG